MAKKKTAAETEYIETREGINQQWFELFENIRVENGLTYQQFVNFTGIGNSRGYYGDFKTNRRFINTEHIAKVQTYFNVDLGV
jgi:transcriptional regulator with XRE-family HTH domain